MKTNTKTSICKRTKLSELVKSVTTASESRQPDLTELMLYEIDQHGTADIKTGLLPKNATFRTMPTTGAYFTTGTPPKPQLSEQAKIRLTEATGGIIKRAKNKKTGKVEVVKTSLYSGAYSEQDFRRCFDFIKAHSDWETLPADSEGVVIEYYLVATDELNHNMRVLGYRWDNLSNSIGRGKKSTRKMQPPSKRISVSVPDTDKPETKSKTDLTFKNKRAAKAYYTKVLKHVGTVCNNGGINISIKIDNINILS